MGDVPQNRLRGHIYPLRNYAKIVCFMLLLKSLDTPNEFYVLFWFFFILMSVVIAVSN